MALELPDWLTTAFGVIGLPWPGIDEDTLRDWATSVRQFADDIVDNSSRTNQTMRQLADSSQSSTISAVADEWERHHQLLTDLHGPIHDFAEALDIAADAVVAQKGVVIGAAAALAAEFTATQIGAIFSLGADEAAVPAEVISTRTIVKFALQTLGGELLGKLINVGAQEVSDHISGSIARMLNEGLQIQGEEQSIKIAYEAVHGVAQEIRGHANTAEDIGNRAHSENTNRDLEDNSGGGGWSEVINALKQGLLDVAGDLFKTLPGTIARVLRDIADLLERLVAKFRRVDEEGDPAVTAGSAKPAITDAGGKVGAGAEPLGTGGKEPAPLGADGEPGTDKPPRKCTGNGDPVDVATGDVMLGETDVTLPGVLPLVLERTHRSSRRTGRWFGRSWMSSLDQRLLITGERIYAGFADGEILTWTPPNSADDPPVVPATGPVCPLRLNPDGSYTVSDPQRGLTWRFEHRAGYEADDDGGEPELPLVSVTDRVGHEIVFNYDAAGRPLSVTHSGGYHVLVTVTDDHVTGLTLAGRDGEDDIPLRQFEYDADGNLSGVINSSGLPLRFTYDDAGRMTSWTDRNGYSYRYTYDTEGRCIRGDGPDGVLSGTFTYEPGITRWTDAAGAVTTYEIADSAEVSAITDPLGNTTRWEHDSRGRVSMRTDPLGRITRYAYDDRGNLLTITRPDGSQATADYDDQSLPVLLTGPDGNSWRQDYDERGNRTLLEAPDGTVTRFSYDTRGNLAAVTGSDGTVTSITCDAAGLPTEVVGPDGVQTRYETDIAGHVVRTIGPNGDVTSLGWTPEGKPASRTFPDGAFETWEWDGEQNLLRHVSPAGAATSWEYGPFDTTTAVTWPDGTYTQFGYDHGQRLTQVKHGGLTWRYEYDPAGHLTAETDYNGAATRYSWDAAGQLTSKTNAAGQAISFSYDMLSNLIGQTADGADTTFGYDPAGRLVSARNADAEIAFDRDALGRVISETSNGRTVRTSYDVAGRITGRVTPSGVSTSWSYNTAGLPARMTAGGQELRFGYDRSGQEVSRALPGGATLTQDWDPRGRLASQTIMGPAGATGDGAAADSGRMEPGTPAQLLQRRSYSYTTDGFVTRLEDLLTGSRTFELDPSGRVTTVTGTEWQERYTYDPVGNVTDASWPAVPSGVTGGWLGAGSQGPREVRGTLVFRAGNIRYRFDAAGRVITRARARISRKAETWRYEWDADNRLAAVTTPDGTVWRYQYDPLGRRTAKLRLDASGRILDETRFTWDGTVLVEQAEVTANGERVITWDYQPGLFTPVAQQTRSSLRDAAEAPQEEIDRRFFAIVTDLTGTPSELVAPDGTVANYQQHMLWGGTIWHRDASTPLRFPGQYADPETGLHYNNQRYYDPVTGSYLSPDPLGLGPAPNHHAYVRNPVVQIDRLGLLRPCVQQALRNWRSQRFQFDNQQFLLDKNDMNHIMTRHMPEFWDGSVKARQTFFHEDMSIQDVQGAIKSVLQQNRETLTSRGTNAIYQIHGTFGGRDYTLGVRYGHIHQFFPDE